MQLLHDLFELLFKYPVATFSAGTIRFAPSWGLFAIAGLALVAGLPILVRYLRIADRRRDRILVVLRTVILGIVLAMLARPMLTVSTLVPLESFVGVLVDDSASMTIRESGGTSRAQRALDLLGTPEEGLLKSLGERFAVRLFAFSEDLRRIDDPAELQFLGETSRLGLALEDAAAELANLPLAGLVVLTDGADNAPGSMDETLLTLKARGLPVYPVGIGAESFDREIEISRVESPRRVLKGSSLMVEVTVEQRGFEGETLTLEVEDDGRIVSTQEVSFRSRGEAAVARVNFQATEAGPREFNFRIAGQRGEVVTENNQRAASIQVEDRVDKILYFEGEPRWELKFLRRAVQDDDNLQLVVLLRSAENRYFRAGLDEGSDGSELEGGFPTSREALFEYRGLILGSIEASFFTHDQLRMIADFVSQRGAGFMMIGGQNAFSEGGWAGTPVADVLPVVLGPAPEGEGSTFYPDIKVELTDFGKSHPALRLAASEEGSEEVWAGLPVVSTFNPIYELKPGATSLLAGSGPGLQAEQIVLAFQRYGRGRALSWSVHDSWKWQMDAEVPLDDMSHERIWRQLMRWLVSYVPNNVNLESATDVVGVGHEVKLRAEILDDTFLAVNNAIVEAEITSPSGEISLVSLRWTVETDGEYVGTFTAREPGTYDVSYEARIGEETLGSGRTHVEAAPSDREYFDAEMRSDLLRQIAEESGGRYGRPRDASRIVDELALDGGGSMRVERFELWDMPAFFAVLLVLLGSEWGLRRRAGMA